MFKENKAQSQISIKDKILENFLRVLTMLEKAILRLIRRNFFHPNQYPPLVLEIVEVLNTIRSWIQSFKQYIGQPAFSYLTSMAIQKLEMMISELMKQITPVSGKKADKSSVIISGHNKLCSAIESMLQKTGQYLEELKDKETSVSIAIEEALYKAFEKHFSCRHQVKKQGCVSTRGENTYIFPWNDSQTYMKLVRDRNRFKKEVTDKLKDHGHQTGHKPSCKGERRYTLAGMRANSRKTIMIGGKQEIFPIRMVKCQNCGQIFSLLPSFLPREKHFGIDLIGQAFQNLVRFSQSIHGVLENVRCYARKISRQTIYNWIRWIGTLHPAVILTRAGVTGTGYLQEDEGVEKEPSLRTYIVVMVEAQTHLVWHADYTDSVNEETLTDSFEKFLQKIEFKLIGVTKDKWKPSTNALKAVFENIWIGFCHRHFLAKLWDGLMIYQKEIRCSYQEIRRLYNEVKKALKTSNSKVSLEVKIKSLMRREEALNHPMLESRLRDLIRGAINYTVNKRRKGITPTTSIVDNFLKIIKRKLRVSESFSLHSTPQNAIFYDFY